MTSASPRWQSSVHLSSLNRCFFLPIKTKPSALSTRNYANNASSAKTKKQEKRKKQSLRNLPFLFPEPSGRQMLAGLGLLSAVALGSKFLGLFFLVFTKNQLLRQSDKHASIIKSFITTCKLSFMFLQYHVIVIIDVMFQ